MKKYKSIQILAVVATLVTVLFLGIISQNNLAARVVKGATIADETSTREIVIHQYIANNSTEATTKAKDATGTTTDGQYLYNLNKALPGVPYTIQKVSPKLNQGQDTIDPSDSSTYTAVGDPFEGVTDDQGVLTDTLGVGSQYDGLYLVTQGTLNRILAKTAPFLVQVPQSVADKKLRMTIHYCIQLMFFQKIN